LKHESSERIQEYITQLGSETEGIIQQVIELTYFMRGSMQYHTIMQISVPERKMIASFLEQRIQEELKKPAGHAVY